MIDLSSDTLAFNDPSPRQRHFRRATAGLCALSLLTLLACEAPTTPPSAATPATSAPASSAPLSPVDAIVAEGAPESVTLKAFNARYHAEGTKPEVVAHLWFEGMFRLLDPSTEADGMQMLETILEAEDWLTAPELKIYAENLHRRPYLFYSYAAAASPGNGYQIDTRNFDLQIVGSEKLDDDRHRLSLKSNGTDTPRFVILAKNRTTGLWQIREFSTIYNGIEPPPSDPPRLLN